MVHQQKLERSRDKNLRTACNLDLPIGLALVSLGSGTTNLPLPVWVIRFEMTDNSAFFHGKWWICVGDSSIFPNFQRISSPDVTEVWNVVMWRLAWAEDAVDPVIPQSTQLNSVSKAVGVPGWQVCQPWHGTSTNMSAPRSMSIWPGCANPGSAKDK